jgi:hypothetical protein
VGRKGYRGGVGLSVIGARLSAVISRPVCLVQQKVLFVVKASDRMTAGLTLVAEWQRGLIAVLPKHMPLMSCGAYSAISVAFAARRQLERLCLCGVPWRLETRVHEMHGIA